MKVIDYLVDNMETLAARWDRNVNVPDYMTGWDIFQDMAEKFLMNPTEFDNEDECAKWVQTCAVNWIMDQKRKETGNIRRELPEQDDEGSATWDQQRRSTGYRSFRYVDYYWSGGEADFGWNFRAGQDEEKAVRQDKRELTSGFPFGQTVVQGDTPEREDERLAKQEQEALAVSLMGNLDPQDQTILGLFFGMVDVGDEQEYRRELNATEIGELLGVTKEHVRRRKAAAINILRRKIDEVR